MEDYPQTLQQFEARFSTEEDCRENLFQLRWPEGFRCPRCGCGKAWAVRATLFQCSSCDCQTWLWLHKLRRAMVRSGRDRLAGWGEVDETYLGGPEEGAVGRGVQDKVLIVIAAQADGRGIGRIRMRVVQHPSAASLHPFIEDCIEPGSTVHTDGLKKSLLSCLGYTWSSRF